MSSGSVGGSSRRGCERGGRGCDGQEHAPALRETDNSNGRAHSGAPLPQISVAIGRIVRRSHPLGGNGPARWRGPARPTGGGVGRAIGYWAPSKTTVALVWDRRRPRVARGAGG